MSDSLQGIDKGCIFRETFVSDASVLNNKGVFGASRPIIRNGYAEFTGYVGRSLVYYRGFNKVVASLRIRVYYDGIFASARFLLDFRRTGDYSQPSIYITPNTNTITLADATGNKYVNGVLNGTLSVGWNDVVIANIIRTYFKNIFVGANYVDNNPLNTKIDLIEFYNTVLTAQEVKNLYENKRFRVSNLNHGEQLGSELITNGGFDDSTGWTVSGGVISGGVWSAALGSYGSGISKTAFNIIQGKIYKLKFTVIVNSGSLRADHRTSTVYTFNTSGTYEYIFLADATTGPMAFNAYNTGFSGSLDNVSIKEVLVNSTKEILNVSADSGAIRNKLSGETINGVTVPSVIPTSVSVVKENDVWAMRFNGSTSKIDCGSYDTLVGNKTFVFWVQCRKFTTVFRKTLIMKGAFWARVHDATGVQLYIGSGAIYPSSGNMNFNQFNNIIFTITSTGIVNFYINGSLSGSANQSAGGILAANASNITIGFGGETMLGLIPSARIIDGILTPEEISQIYNSERGRYGL